jgi:hypothetical protein
VSIRVFISRGYSATLQSVKGLYHASEPAASHHVLDKYDLLGAFGDLVSRR